MKLIALFPILKTKLMLAMITHPISLRKVAFFMDSLYFFSTFYLEDYGVNLIFIRGNNICTRGKLSDVDLFQCVSYSSVKIQKGQEFILD